MDVKINVDNGCEFDLGVVNGDLETGNELETSVILSVLTDKRALESDDVLGWDRRGWWADTYSEVVDDKFGSRLWTLNREKETDETLKKAQEIIYESLEWIIEDDIAKTITVDVEWIRSSVLGIYITINKPAEALEIKFQYVWEDIE